MNTELSGFLRFQAGRDKEDDTVAYIKPLYAISRNLEQSELLFGLREKKSRNFELFALFLTIYI